MIDQLVCYLISFANMLMDVLVNWWVELLILVLNLLPTADLAAEPLEWGPFGHLIGYFLPVQQMVNHFSFILSLLVLYFAVQHMLRFLKMIK